MPDDQDYAYLEKQFDDGPAPASVREEEVSGRGSSRREKDRKDRSRSRDRDRNGGRRERESRGDRDHERRDRDGGRDKGREDGRGGGRERDHGDRRRDNTRGGGYGGGRDSRDNYHSRRATTPPEERAAREQAKELKEMERATRTLLASNVNLRAEEKDVFMFFSKAGTVQDVQMIKDRNRRFKGFVYVEMATQDEVLKGLQMTGQLLLGQPVWVKSSEHERNMQWELEQARAAQLTEQQQAADASGVPLLPMMAPGLMMPGLGLASLAGLDLGSMDAATLVALYGAAGMAAPATAAPGGALPPPPLGPAQAQALLQLQQQAQAQQQAQQQGALPPQDLDDMEDNKGGLRLNAQARMALMNKLASSAGMGVTAAMPGGGVAAGQQHQPGYGPPPGVDTAVTLQQGLLGPSSPIPTQYLLLKNMFSPEEEAANGEGWDLELARDVAEECSKYGQVVHCHVDKTSQGHVYLKYASVEAATAAQHGLNGRWFASKRIVAEFQFAHAYQQLFGQ